MIRCLTYLDYSNAKRRNITTMVKAGIVLTLSLLQPGCHSTDDDERNCWLHRKLCSTQATTLKLAYKSDVDLTTLMTLLHQWLNRLLAPAMCAKTQQDKKLLFLASSYVYSVSKVIMKFVLSMPLFVTCELVCILHCVLSFLAVFQ